MLLLLLAAAVGFAAGAAAAALLVSRNTHRLVARLPHPERIEFARKVNAASRR